MYVAGAFPPQIYALDLIEQRYGRGVSANMIGGGIVHVTIYSPDVPGGRVSIDIQPNGMAFNGHNQNGGEVLPEMIHPELHGW